MLGFPGIHCEEANAVLSPAKIVLDCGVARAGCNCGCCSGFGAATAWANFFIASPTVFADLCMPLKSNSLANRFKSLIKDKYCGLLHAVQLIICFSPGLFR